MACAALWPSVSLPPPLLLPSELVDLSGLLLTLPYAMVTVLHHP